MKQLWRFSFCDQRGFTLLEILVATALVGIITSAFSSFFFQMVKTDQSSSDRVTAIRNLETAGNWFILDFQPAQTVPPMTTLNPGIGSLTIYQSVGGTGDATVIYDIGNNGDLYRTIETISDNTTSTTSSIVARNITSVTYITGTASSPGTIDVTATVGTIVLNKTYKVGSRISASDAELTILTTALPGGDWGASYYEAIIAYGGSLPYSYAVTSGSLPSWADATDFATLGEVSGTPTALGTSSFTVTVTDAIGTQYSQAYSITINSAMSDESTITPTSLPNGYIGESYGPIQFAIASGGTAPFYWSTPDTLPDGLDLILRGGILSGIPTAETSSTFEVVVTDAAGDTRTTTRSISIVPIPAQFTEASIYSDNGSPATTLTTEDGSYPAQKLCIVANPRNGNYQAVIHCSLKNMLSENIKVEGVTSTNDSGGVITVNYGGVLAGNAEIPANTTDKTGSITLTALSGGGPYYIVITYERA